MWRETCVSQIGVRNFHQETCTSVSEQSGTPFTFATTARDVIDLLDATHRLSTHASKTSNDNATICRACLLQGLSHRSSSSHLHLIFLTKLMKYWSSCMHPLWIFWEDLHQVIICLMIHPTMHCNKFSLWYYHYSLWIYLANYATHWNSGSWIPIQKKECSSRLCVGPQTYQHHISPSTHSTLLQSEESVICSIEGLFE